MASLHKNSEKLQIFNRRHTVKGINQSWLTKLIQGKTTHKKCAFNDNQKNKTYRFNKNEKNLQIQQERKKKNRSNRYNS